jgi:N-acetylmuramoyl-L-alanine amidase
MRKAAILIGHTKDSKGAYSKWLPSEFDYNIQVAEELKKINPSLYTVYTHDSYLGGYYAMEKRTAETINKEDFSIVLELHYNSASPLAHGTECCYWFASKKGKEYAQKISEEISQRLDTTNRGIKALYNKNDRGYWFTYLMKAPAVIVEPFFGSNEFDALKFQDPKKYASVLNEIISTL